MLLYREQNTYLIWHAGSSTDPGIAQHIRGSQALGRVHLQHAEHNTASEMCTWDWYHMLQQSEQVAERRRDTDAETDTQRQRETQKQTS